MKKFWLVALAVAVIAGSAMADSLWSSEKSYSPYSSQKTFKVGDIVNVLIIESTSAKNKAGTTSNVKDDLAASFSHSIARLSPIIGTNNSLTGQLSNKYTGDGQTTRSNNVQARIAAWVTDVLPNGNLALKGQHRVEVNNELQEITITGIIRPKDIVNGNSVFSYQVANASLSVSGTGTVSESSAPGWITRIFNWLF